MKLWRLQKKYSTKESAAFINGILDRIAKEEISRNTTTDSKLNQT